MPKKYSLPMCPVETTLSLIGNKWKILIIRDLLNGTKRFGELKKSFDTISQKVLTQHLRHMEKSGLIYRKVYAQIPPKVEYSLSNVGLGLKLVLEAMWRWGEEYKNSFK